MLNIKTTQTNVPEGVIDLGVGQPSLSLLPTDAMKQAALHRLGKNDPCLLQYGAEQGDGYFRLELAKFLSEKYGMPVEADHLFITCGASQGLDLICTLFTHPGDTVFVEEPTYFLALRIFADYHLNVTGLPVDENGLIIEALEEMLVKCKPAFLYTIPVFQNPSGVTLSPDRRKRLVSLSQKNNFHIVADEVYHLLSYTDVTPPLPMTIYDETGTVFSVGSFSKIMGPGLRLGWIHARPALLSRLSKSALLDSGGGLNPFTSGLVRSAIELGLLDNHLDCLKKVYQQRMTALSAALRDHMSEYTSFDKPAGGFFIWLRLPEKYDAMSLLSKAKEHDAGFQPGIRFSSQQGMKNYVRLSFSYYDEAKLEQGVMRLARVLNNL